MEITLPECYPACSVGRIHRYRDQDHPAVGLARYKSQEAAEESGLGRPRTGSFQTNNRARWRRGRV